MPPAVTIGWAIALLIVLIFAYRSGSRMINDPLRAGPHNADLYGSLLVFAHRSGGGVINEPLCAGPHNVGLYDSPYQHYPRYEGRRAVNWDGDGRCQASCGQSPCTVWCR